MITFKVAALQQAESIIGIIFGPSSKHFSFFILVMLFNDKLNNNTTCCVEVK